MVIYSHCFISVIITDTSEATKASVDTDAKKSEKDDEEEEEDDEEEASDEVRSHFVDHDMKIGLVERMFCG